MAHEDQTTTALKENFLTKQGANLKSGAENIVRTSGT
jgi:hypothetical protein